MSDLNHTRAAAIVEYIGLDDIGDLNDVNDGDALFVSADDANITVSEALARATVIPRYLLHERGRYKNDWFSLHFEPDDAAKYSDGQEYAEDWANCTLIDLDTGDEFWAERNTRFVKKDRA